MRVKAATISVSHPFEVVTKAKVVAIIGFRDVNSLVIRRINGAAVLELFPDLQFLGRPRVLFRRLLLLARMLRQGGGGQLDGVPLYLLVPLAAGRNILEEKASLSGLLSWAGSFLLQVPAAELQSLATAPSVSSPSPDKSSR